MPVRKNTHPPTPPKNPDKPSFYECVDTDMDGNQVRMDAFRGEVLVAVNVASE